VALIAGAMLRASPAAAAPVFMPEESLAVGDEMAVPAGQGTCQRTLRADVVALDQVIFYNRLDVFLPSGMIYALRRDVEAIGGGTALTAGNVRLRSDKRPRPLVLRMNVGDCLQITFQNLLAAQRVNAAQPATRTASMMVDGLSLVGSIASSGSNVGANPSSLVPPGGTATYTWYASKEGAFLFNSAGAMTGGEGDGGQPDHGLFGVVNVEPRASVWYRSQLTANEIQYATTSTDASGFRRINYDAVYPVGHRFAGRPVVKILDGTSIFHGDLNAIIANIPAGTYPNVVSAAPDNNGVNRDRNDPFREFTVVYHDENGVVQAFPVLSQAFFAHSVRDNMAINYGTGGAGAEIISYGANEIVQGPFGSPHIPAGNAKLCNDCKYEEAFLSSWTVGDPAMVVERQPVTNDCAALPDGAPTAGCTPGATGQAIRALYPDDPSNVHHSYLNDHVKMRVVHGGVAEHHIHHLHAHQWLHQQNSDNSNYFDSQAIGPGSTYTLDISYNGSGNRNKTVGDSIFHCHFYPHFAQGMWELWRVHDVFEDGTRKLPDAEVPGGTPIPAVLPIPGQAMAVPPTSTMPGYPFFIPGIAGHRPPHPPLDTVDDGGLPRHVVRGGSVLDGQRGPFDRIALEMDAMLLPEDGTLLEKNAMAFHAQRTRPTVTPSGTPATFITNGRPAVAGAPYADPCVDDNGNPVGTPRTIKAAVLQLDNIINKVGWHFPQSRIISLWGDVQAYQNGTRAPEPFFVRAHSNDCITYHHTNLLPEFYDVDDFQIFTPTDVVGQHIHLVKFDVTASDGSGNGWNYEDGTFSPGEVIERIEAINATCTPNCTGPTCCGLDQGSGTRRLLQARAHPTFGVLGAQTTIQRWWADPLLNAQGHDRTIRTVYTHDHFAPSTHQQTGLYAALLVEPAGTTWRDPESGAVMGGRSDGGPTSWRADILTPNPADSFREFMLEFQDFALAYTADNKPVNPPGRVEVGLPFIVAPPAVPMPEAISADDVGTFTINYRNEPIALRVRDPARSDADGSNGVQATGDAGDLAQAYRSDIVRADPALNVQPTFYPPLTADVGPGDPFTPLLRAYEGDRVQIRMLVGATEEGHDFTIHGMRWLHEPDDPRSGWKNGQMSGISEHFEFDLSQMPEFARGSRRADYPYMPGASVDDQWNGMWGLLRNYEACVSGDSGCPGTLRSDLLALPSNPDGRRPSGASSDFITSNKICPLGAPVRNYTVSAVQADRAIPGGRLIYNQGHSLGDPTALMYVLASDLDANGVLRPGVPIEPLVLRANAGECIMVTLNNRLTTQPPELAGFNLFPPIINKFNANQVRPSNRVGLHPQLVTFDPRAGNGINAGVNLDSTVAPGGSRTYEWYAGIIEVQEDRTVIATPVEFGAVNLMPADLLKQSHKGLVGALVIEPWNATWSLPEPGTRAVADITHPGGTFREFVTVWQDDLQLRRADGTPVPFVGGPPEDSEDSGNKAINYRTEPMWTRAGFAPGTEFQGPAGGVGENDVDLTNVLSLVGGGPIETPIFSARVGTPVRFRVLEPQGHGRNHVITIHGHQWRHEPGNPDGDWQGSQAEHGPANHWDIIPLHGAGGAMGVAGDYLYRNRASLSFDAGMWGVFRVTAAAGGTTTTTAPPATTTTVPPATTTTTTAPPPTTTTTTTLPPAAPVTLFYDPFGGLTNWTESGEGDWNTEALHATTDYPATGSNSPAAHSDTCTTSCTITMTNALNLSGRTSAQLTLLRFVDSELDAGEYLRFEVWNGSTWVRLGDWSADNAADTNRWHAHTFDLAAYLGRTDFKVRFVTKQSNDVEHVHVDDVKITAINGTATTTTTVPPPTTTTVASTTTTAPPATTTTTTLPPAAVVATVTEDARVDSGSASTNFGTSSTLAADASPIRNTFVKINVSGIAGRTVTSAQLRLTATSNGSDSGGIIRRLTNCTWTETGITFSNQPAIPTTSIGAALGAINASAVATFSLDITVDGQHCFVITSNSTDSIEYNSREASTTSLRPVVAITVSGGATTTTVPPATTTTTTVAPTTTTAPPATTTTTTTLPPAAVVATVTADARVDSGSTSTNFGTSSTLAADADPIKRTFLKIDVSGIAGRTVTSAQLRLTATSNGSDSGGIIRRLTSCTWTETGITYSNQPAIPTTSVGAALGTVNSGAVATFALGITADGQHCFVITSNSTDGIEYNSREASTASTRPVVAITTNP
jgi:hypothetical protein